MLTPDTLRAAFDRGLPYRDYTATGSPHHQQAWSAFRDRATLTKPQTDLIRGFTPNSPTPSASARAPASRSSSI